MRKTIKNNITKLILLILMLLIVFNFIIPNYSFADEISPLNDIGNFFGGVLLDPIRNLTVLLGDTVMSAANALVGGINIPAVSGIVRGKEEHWQDRWAYTDISTKLQIWNFDTSDDFFFWPTMIVTPEEIFSGKILSLNVNFLNKAGSYGDNIFQNIVIRGSNGDTSTVSVSNNGSVSQNEKIGNSVIAEGFNGLRAQISKWYQLIRNLSASALFCVLIYLGIRILLSSISEERAKYKSMLYNWVIALCLVFFLHYIMVVIMYITDKSVEVIGNGLTSTYQVNKPWTNDKEEFVYLIPNPTVGINAGDDAKVYNLIELTRVYSQAGNRWFGLMYLFIYMVLVVYTIIFIVKYMKRYMYMAFLTMIAPVIAFTYPIDKVKDGQAQAFNKWLTEYLFNALLQPLHLLIWIVLVGSATQLVTANPIFAIVALAFINSAEKLLREFFGMNKATTAPGVGGFSKGVLASQLLNRVKSSNVSTKGSGGKGGGKTRPRQVTMGDAYGSNALLNDSSSPATPTRRGKEIRGKKATTPGQSNMTVNMQEQNTGIGNNPLNGGNLGGAEQTNIGTIRLDGRSNGQEFNNQEDFRRKLRKLTKEKGTDNIIARPKQKRQITGPIVQRQMTGPIVQEDNNNIKQSKFKKAARYVGPKIGKLGLRAAIMMPGILIGGAAAIATGNKDYLMAGAGIGAALGSKATQSIPDGKGKYDKFIKDRDNLKYFREKYGSEQEARRRIEAGRDFINAGYTDAEDVDRLTRMKEAIDGATVDQVIFADNMASQFKPETLIDEKKSNEIEENLANQIQSSSGGTETQARELAHQHVNLMRVSHGLGTTNMRPKQNIEPKNAETQNEQPKSSKEEQKEKRKSRNRSRTAEGRTPTRTRESKERTKFGQPVEAREEKTQTKRKYRSRCK